MVIVKPAFSSILKLLKVKHKYIETQRGQSPSACRESGPLMTYPGWDYRRPSVLHSGLNVGRPPEA